MKLHSCADLSQPSLFTIGISIIASILNHNYSRTSIAHTLIAHSPKAGKKYHHGPYSSF